MSRARTLCHREWRSQARNLGEHPWNSWCTAAEGMRGAVAVAQTSVLAEGSGSSNQLSFPGFMEYKVVEPSVTVAASVTCLLC